MAPPRRPTSGKQPAVQQDRKAELLQAYQDVVKFANEKPKPPRPEPPSRLPFWIASAGLIVVLIVLTIWQPSWLFTQPLKETPALMEASLRVRIYGEILRIERYQATNSNKLPSALTDVGGDTTGVAYKLTNTTYTLTGRNGPLTIIYKSDMPAKQFLGNSYSLIRARSRRS